MRRFDRVLFVGLVFACLAALDAAAQICPAPGPAPPPSELPPSGAFDCTRGGAVAGLLAVKEPVADRYIVVLRETPEVAATTEKLGKRYGLTAQRLYQHALHGFAGKMNPGQAKQLAEDPEVAFVEQVGKVRISAVASWGLDRIDQRDLPLDQSFTPPSAGAGIHAYVFDTGLDASHVDFTGRIGEGYASVPGGCADDHGHGTHVAGTIGGTSYGVAKSVTIHPIRVLQAGAGSTDGVIAGIDWATSHVNANRWPAVANLSLGGFPSVALDLAVCRSLAAGIQYGIAAGNSNVSACGSSPARVWQAMTVGASAITDARASFSNWGACTDLFAPGQNILSARRGGGEATMSGTSMAAPHVTGALALCLAQTPGSTPKQLEACLESAATPNKITSPGSGSPNLLLFVGPL